MRIGSAWDQDVCYNFMPILDWTRTSLRSKRSHGGVSMFFDLIDFLGQVATLAEELGLRLCCHPDDPPFSLLGLPRVMSSSDDYAAVLDAVDLPANGATFCTGSLGVRSDFHGPAFVRRHGPRI